MALLTYPDLQEALNIDLTDPNGQTIATSLISAAVSQVEKALGYPLEQSSVTEYFDGSSNQLWLSTAAPVSELVLDIYNATSQAYDTLPATFVRHAGGSQVFTTASLPSGFQSVRATYTTGWTSATFPSDLRRALIDLVALKLQEVTNYASNPDDPAGNGSGVGAGTLRKVSAGSYTEEYVSGQSEALWKAKAEQLSRTIGSSLPSGIQEVVARYRVPFAL